MKKLLIIGLFLTLSTQFNVFNVTTTTLQAGQACVDCGGACGKPERPEIA